MVEFAIFKLSKWSYQDQGGSKRAGHNNQQWHYFCNSPSGLETPYASHVCTYSKSLNIGNSIIGIFAIPGSLYFLDYQGKFDYHDFSRKIPILEVNKCFVVNLKIQLSGFFEIFGHTCPDIQGLAVHTLGSTRCT